ncbi:MAG: phage protein GemA/Gp16 family protein [Candidatus Margulisiibacteriota bacterium]
MKNSNAKIDPDKELYLRQNKAIHKARAQLGMELDDCRELARQMFGKASLSSLSLEQRSELIDELKAKGTKVFNPKELKPQRRETAYFEHLASWDKRFPKGRRGFASNKQLAWIETLWTLDFDDGRTDSKRGLRGFLWRQTKSLENGPVSDLAFLRDNHVDAVITPLLQRARKKQDGKNRR